MGARILCGKKWRKEDSCRLTGLVSDPNSDPDRNAVNTLWWPKKSETKNSVFLPAQPPTKKTEFLACAAIARPLERLDAGDLHAFRRHHARLAKIPPFFALFWPCELKKCPSEWPLRVAHRRKSAVRSRFFCSRGTHRTS